MHFDNEWDEERYWDMRQDAIDEMIEESKVDVYVKLSLDVTINRTVRVMPDRDGEITDEEIEEQAIEDFEESEAYKAIDEFFAEHPEFDWDDTTVSIY